MIDSKDQEFFQVFSIVLAALGLIAAVAIFAALTVVGDTTESDPRYAPEQIAARIAPVGQVRGSGDAEVTTASAAAEEEESKPAGPRSGADIVASACSGCHAAGVMGAPKTDDKAAWSAIYARGMDSVVTSAINGKGSMPPRGGCGDCSDNEIRDAIIEMMTGAGVDVAETQSAASSVEQVSETVKAAASSASDAVQSAAQSAVESAQDVASTAADAASNAADSVTATIHTAANAVAKATAPEADLDRGREIYNQACVGCHSAGVAGAPRYGDNVAWSQRLANGMDALIASAMKGKGAMPPKGGCFNCSDADIRDAVAFITQ